jgi:uncharacterized protein YxjI
MSCCETLTLHAAAGILARHMRYQMKQKLFSWGDKFIIQDESGREIFQADGAVFTLGNQLSFHDMGG